MKKNFLIAAASVALLLGSDLAIAADVSFSGQIRPRMESRDHDFHDDSEMQTYMGTRVRLNAKATANQDTSVFLQFQSVGIWGQNDSDSSGTRQATGGGNNQALDVLDDVGLHQAYFTLKNLYNTGLTAKVGRQEVVLDGHRLFGHTGWTHGAQTQDAAAFTHSHGNHTIKYIFIKGVEDASGSTYGAYETAGTSQHDENDYNVHIFHVNTQGIMGGDLSGYAVFTDDNNTGTSPTGLSGIGQEWWTVGARQKGKAAGFDYRVEFYHQFGDAGGTANAGFTGGTAIYTATTFSDDVDRDAYMFGVRVGKTFKNVQYSPNVTLWYDHLSGTDDQDGTDQDMASFDTHHDTGHKFYGFMDHYLARDGGRTEYMGLRDLAIKTKFKAAPGFILKADYHQFWTDTDYGDNPAMALTTAYNTADGALGQDLGNELDVTLVHKYASNVKLVYGYSHYWNTMLFAALNGTHNRDGEGNVTQSNDSGSDWAYIMADVKF